MRFLRFWKDSEDSDKILARVYEDSGELPTPDQIVSFFPPWQLFGWDIECHYPDTLLIIQIFGLPFRVWQ
jgi:hypothetical protein